MIYQLYSNGFQRFLAIFESYFHVAETLLVVPWFPIVSSEYGCSKFRIVSPVHYRITVKSELTNQQSQVLTYRSIE